MEFDKKIMEISDEALAQVSGGTGGDTDTGAGAQDTNELTPEQLQALEQRTAYLNEQRRNGKSK